MICYSPLSIGVFFLNSISACQEGLQEVSYRIIRILRTLECALTFPVSLFGFSFKSIQVRALRSDELQLPFRCKCVLLEPVMLANINIPHGDVGTVSKDISRRRGPVLSVNPEGHMSVIRCLCPLASALDYSADLQRMTAGLGTFTMEVEAYNEVPHNLAAEILKTGKSAKRG